MKTKNISIRVDEETKKWLTDRAKEENRSVSNLVVDILVKWKNKNIENEARLKALENWQMLNTPIGPQARPPVEQHIIDAERAKRKVLSEAFLSREEVRFWEGDKNVG